VRGGHLLRQMVHNVGLEPVLRGPLAETLLVRLSHSRPQPCRPLLGRDLFLTLVEPRERGQNDVFGVALGGAGGQQQHVAALHLGEQVEQRQLIGAEALAAQARRITAHRSQQGMERAHAALWRDALIQKVFVREGPGTATALKSHLSKVMT
jgi:hypothetical protein